MVRDVHDALERALGDPPDWRLDLDGVVATGRRARRRRRVALTAATSAAAVLAAGAALTTPTVMTQLRGVDPARVTVVGPAGRPTSTAASRTPTVPTADGVSSQTRREAFTQAGYDRSDAVLLARLWGHGTTPDGAMVRAGDKVLNGQQLPIRHGMTAQTVTEEVALDAYFGNGYGYEDAVRLAARWHPGSTDADVPSVKAEAGRRILAGQDLPTLH
jgi:hypothetical protein